jgi:hypothetical protein
MDIKNDCKNGRRQKMYEKVTSAIKKYESIG